MENLKPFAYTSELTGNTYEVVPVVKHRTMFATFMNPASRYIEDYIEYDIYLDGEKVQFTFNPEDVSLAVGRYEGVSDGWYCTGRD